MLNAIWLGLVLVSVAVASLNGRMEEVSKASLDQAVFAIQFVLKLTGGMVLFLGLVKAASDGGLLRVVVRGMRPLLRRLFPDVPADHPAMNAIVMNFSANVLGLGNAATPFGIKAMVELDRLNPRKGVATDAMALFLAINTSSIVLLPPTGTVMARLATGSDMPFAIWVPTLIATLCSTVVAVASCLLLARLPLFRARPLPDPPPDDGPAPEEADLPDATLPGLDTPREPLTPGQWGVIGAFVAVLGYGLVRALADAAADGGASAFLRDEVANHWLLPILIAALALVGFAGRVRVYDALVEGGREGLQVAVRITPYLVAILVAIGCSAPPGPSTS